MVQYQSCLTLLLSAFSFVHLPNLNFISLPPHLACTHPVYPHSTHTLKILPHIWRLSLDTWPIHAPVLLQQPRKIMSWKSINNDHMTNQVLWVQQNQGIWCYSKIKHVANYKPVMRRNVISSFVFLLLFSRCLYTSLSSLSCWHLLHSAPGLKGSIVFTVHHRCSSCNVQIRVFLAPGLKGSVMRKIKQHMNVEKNTHIPIKR